MTEDFTVEPFNFEARRCIGWTDRKGVSHVCPGNRKLKTFFSRGKKTLRCPGCQVRSIWFLRDQKNKK